MGREKNSANKNSIRRSQRLLGLTKKNAYNKEKEAKVLTIDSKVYFMSYVVVFTCRYINL